MATANATLLLADTVLRLDVQLGLVIVMVIGIHMIEAYGLNPAIYSAHLKLHPLLVLTVLVVAEHSLGVWGLLLAGAPRSGCMQGSSEHGGEYVDAV